MKIDQILGAGPGQSLPAVWRTADPIIHVCVCVHIFAAVSECIDCLRVFVRAWLHAHDRIHVHIQTPIEGLHGVRHN